LECADCLVPLSDRRPLTLEELGGEDDQIEYDFEELEPIARLAVDELFWTNGIPHAWAETALVVRAEDEEEADRLIDAADRDAFLESEAEQVSYDLGDWDDERRALLTDALSTANIEHAWDEHGELVVFEDEEERVDAIVDAIEFPDQVKVDDEDEIEAEEALAADGHDPQDVLSELFVSADRLMHDPMDHEGVLSLVDAARLAESLPLPYGFAPAVWNDVLTQVRSLRASLEGDDEDDDEDIIGRATTLRATLRNFV
jgi:hypothetical protein